MLKLIKGRKLAVANEQNDDLLPDDPDESHYAPVSHIKVSARKPWILPYRFGQQMVALLDFVSRRSRLARSEHGFRSPLASRQSIMSMKLTRLSSSPKYECDSQEKQDATPEKLGYMPA
jgi:hypothetical protein